MNTPENSKGPDSRPYTPSQSSEDVNLSNSQFSHKVSSYRDSDHSTSDPKNSSKRPNAPKQVFRVEVYDKQNPIDLTTASQLGTSFRKVYGPGYPCKEFDKPQEFINTIANGEWISIVVRDSAGMPIGHAAIIPYGDKVAEYGRLFTDPAAQGLGIGKLLVAEQIKLGEQLAQQGQLAVVQSEPVTSHLVSQRMYDKYPFVPTALFDRKYTDFFSAGYRESIVRLSKILDPVVKQHRDVYIPSVFQNISTRIYSDLGCQRRSSPRAIRQAPGATYLNVGTYDFDDFELISLAVGPSRAPLQVVQDARQQFAAGAHYVSVRLDVTHPDAIAQVHALRAEGFFFAALETHPSSDYLVLQKLSDAHTQGAFPHVSNLHDPAAQQLLADIHSTRFVQ